jgi:hypothetical protein
MKTAVVLLALLLSTSLISAQRVRAAGWHIADQASSQFEKSIPPPLAAQPQRIEPSELRQAAYELASLSQSIPPAVDQTTKGLLPKDLDQKLKRIEKLARELRSKIYR